ncbi:MAG: alkaline phosphatase [Solirubrobacterales bacterium]
MPGRPLRWAAPFALLAAAATATGVALGGNPAETNAQGSTGNSVVVLVGDGLGPAHRTASQLAKYGYDEIQPMDALPEGGNLLTHTGTRAIGESGAGATAMATGVKTRNNHAGVDAEGNRLETLQELARDRGKSTGLISDNDATNATLAGFAAHTDNRDHKRQIARQYLTDTKPDLIFGGGEKIWYPKGEGKIPDQLDDDPSNNKVNLVEQAKGLGYQYAYDRETFASLTGPKALALVQEQAYLRGHELRGYRRSKDPHFVNVPTMFQKALDILGQDPDGFFLVAEIDGLDDSGHEHDGKTTISGAQLINRMVSRVTTFQETNPNTLLVVTADHETGGMTIEGPRMPSQNSPGDDPVPEYGKPENMPLPSAETPKRWGPFKVKGSDDKFNVDWTTPEHTGTMVPVTASGPGAERFSGVHQNTWVHTVAKDVLNGG